jgi:hypothetical protein
MTPETPTGTGQRSKNSDSGLELTVPAMDTVPPGKSFMCCMRERFGKRLAALSALLLLEWGLTACATLNAPTFSGGGVPIGGSRVFGRVVSAANPATNLSNVTVKIEATPSGGTPRDLQTTTGQDGSFSFSNVLPGFSSGTVQVTATPSDPAFQAQEIGFTVSNGHTQQMIVTLPPASFDPATATSITIGVASPAVPSGGSIEIQAVLRDGAGKPLSVSPTLVFDGNFGMLNTDGTFFVPQGILTGSGTITAFWFGLPPQSQQIHVDPNASPQPPSPPVLPGGDNNIGH